MNSRRNLLLVAILIVSAGGSFVATYALQVDRAPASNAASGQLSAWLNLAPDERTDVAPLEAAYREDRRALEAAVVAERDRLAALFEAGDSSDAEILAQVERVVGANNALERRTARFLLDVRPHLTPAQQHRLLHYFAEGVREGGRYRWRHGWQRNSDATHESDTQPAGRGQNRGRRGPPWSGGGRP